MLKITILAMGDKMPGWVSEGTHEYAKRFVHDIQLKIIEIPLIRRGKSADLTRILEKESTKMLSMIPDNSLRIALDVKGQAFNSQSLAKEMTRLQQLSSHWCLLIGGPEGLSQEILQTCAARWSLSQLTMPHPIVRIVLLESLYRGWSIIHDHPYHRE